MVAPAARIAMNSFQSFSRLSCVYQSILPTVVQLEALFSGIAGRTAALMRRCSCNATKRLSTFEIRTSSAVSRPTIFAKLS